MDTGVTAQQAHNVQEDTVQERAEGTNVRDDLVFWDLGVPRGDTAPCNR